MYNLKRLQNGVDRVKTTPKILLILGIVGLIIGLILYFHGTVTLEVKDVPIKLDKATYYTSQGFSTNYYSQIQVEPTAAAEPNINYLLVLNNGIIKQNYEVSWSQLELAIHKSKTVTNKISQDEYTALGMNAAIMTDTFEVRPHHQILYLMPGIAILVAFILLYRASLKRPERQQYDASPTPTRKPSASSSRVPPPHGTFYVSPDGTATDTPPPNASETIETHEFAEPMEYIKSERKGIHLGIWQDINNQKLNRLVQEGKLKPRDALEFKRAIEEHGGDFSSQKDFESLLEAIDHGVESQRQEHDRLPDSIFKKYGIDPNKFRL